MHLRSLIILLALIAGPLTAADEKRCCRLISILPIPSATMPYCKRSTARPVRPRANACHTLPTTMPPVAIWPYPMATDRSRR